VAATTFAICLETRDVTNLSPKPQIQLISTAEPSGGFHEES
jgi:hypothetical protein